MCVCELLIMVGVHNIEVKGYFQVAKCSHAKLNYHHLIVS